MNLAKGPRPWSIKIFAAMLLIQGLWELAGGLLSLEDAVTVLAIAIPSLDWNRDLAIVALSANFTIVLIPVVAVWVFASRIARALLTLFALLSLVTAFATLWLLLDARFADWSVLLDGLVTPLAVALLYTPNARAWLRTKGKGESHAFA